MIAALLMMICLCAEEPEKKPLVLSESVRDYFRRSDEQRLANIRKLNNAITDLNVELRNAPKQAHPAIKKRIVSLTTALATAEKTTPQALIPPAPRERDVGTLPPMMVVRIVSDSTVILVNQRANAWYVVGNTDTEKMKPGQIYGMGEVWQVTSENVTDTTTIRAIVAVQGNVRKSIMIDQLSPSDIQAALKLYEAEKAANGGKPLPRTAEPTP